MVLRVDYLIFAYMFLCLCILLFDFYYMWRERWIKKHEPKKVERYILEYRIRAFGNRELNEKQEKRLARKLRSSSKLLVFNEAISTILDDKSYAPLMKNWLWDNRGLFFQISDAYTKGNDPVKEAFFAYIVWQYELCGKSEHDVFVQLMYQSCMQPSLYCRENSLCALYVSGAANNVVKAYLLLARKGIEHNPRLVTDGLMMFTGSHNELADALWEHWDEFSPAYQTAFINYFRMTTDRFADRLPALLQEEGIDSEVRFAVIRYCRRYRCPGVERILQDMVWNWDVDDWEFASIAALALDNYHGRDSVEALVEGCHSVHWYVRDNASESLLKIAGLDTIQRIIAQESDPFTRDMLTYKCSRRKKEIAV